MKCDHPSHDSIAHVGYYVQDNERNSVSILYKCPKCGGTNVPLNIEESVHVVNIKIADSPPIDHITITFRNDDD